MQTTLLTPVRFTGIGLHSGHPVRMTVRPATANHGVWFKRTDIRLGDAMVPARWDVVEPTPLCTRLVNRAGVSVSTVEHLMAALAGCGIHNALVEIDGPEVPILDGSAVEFVRAFLNAGLRQQSEALHAIEILRPVETSTDKGTARLVPGQGMSMRFDIDFADAAIGRQTRTLDLANGAFVRELSDSRTFCFRSDVELMQANGFARGGQPGLNAVVFDDGHVASPGGLRHADEPVRHKMLDALGDLALAGAPIIGRYEGDRAGHSMTNALLRALFARPDAYRLVECDATCAARLPGTAVRRDEIPNVA